MSSRPGEERGRREESHVPTWIAGERTDPGGVSVGRGGGAEEHK